MKRSIFIQMFLRHLLLVSAVLFLTLTVMERLAPESVLAYVHFFWLIPLLIFLLSVGWMKEVHPQDDPSLDWWRLGWIPLLILILAFFWITVRDAGRSGHLLFFAAIILAIAFFMALLYAHDHTSYE